MAGAACSVVSAVSVLASPPEESELDAFSELEELSELDEAPPEDSDEAVSPPELAPPPELPPPQLVRSIVNDSITAVIKHKSFTFFMIASLK